MRTDALGMIIRHAVADLQLTSSQDAVLDFLNDAEADSDGVRRALVALASLHPEYTRLAAVPVGGRPPVRVEQAGSGQPPGSEATDTALTGGPEAVYVRALGGAFVTLVANRATFGQSERADSRIDLLVGVGLENQGGQLALTLTSRLSWEDVLRQYARAHPGSVSGAFLRTDADGRVFSAESAEDTAPGTLHAEVGGPAAALPDVALASEDQIAIGGGLLTYATIYPQQIAHGALSAEAPFASTPELAGHQPTWKVISWVSPATFRGVRFLGLLGLIGWNVFGIGALGVISWFSADRLARRSALHEKTAAERSLLSSAFERYMSKVRAESLLADPRQYAALGGTSREAAVLFADVRGFTRYAERHDPPYVVATLNSVLASLVPALRSHSGVLDKYLGDGFLAYFLPSEGGGPPAQRAVDAALEMQEAFSELCRRDAGQVLAGLGLGIGVSTGTVILGNVGAENLMDFTVIGDTVNVAARLQGAAGAGEILITDETAQAIGPTVKIRPRRVEVELRGRAAPVAAWVLAGESWTRFTT